MANRHDAHGELVAGVLLALSKLRPLGVFAWRNPTGGFLTPRGTRIKVGTKGQPDILGVVAGKAFAVEAKTGRGRLSIAQKIWRDVYEHCGGRFVIARSIEDAVSGVVEIRGGRR